MEVVPVPVLSDNYAYLLIDRASRQAAAVDPAEPAKVLAAAREHGVTLSAVLTTHHHWDHSGGNEDLLKQLQTQVPVYGGDNRIPGLTNKVGDQDQFKIGDVEVTVLFTPCHTTGHVLYLASAGQQPKALFCGDTLFIGGCGRFFEGTADQMYHALVEVVASLPKDTLVYCGHEYTVKNLQFAETIEPDNDALQAKLKWAQEKQSQNEFTVPSTVEEELAYNPFMRVNERSVKAALKMEPDAHPHDVMRELRLAKDNWKGKL